ncbi:MAG: hypothetical protein AB8H86_23100 [Polyangiales bacterium]
MRSFAISSCLMLAACSGFGVADRVDAGVADGGSSDSSRFDASLVDTESIDVSASLDAPASVDASPDAGANDECTTVDFCDGLSRDDNCDEEVNEGCGLCAAGFAECPGGCCEVAETVLAEMGEYPSMFVDDRGNILVAYTASRLTHLARYDAEGSAWTDRLVSDRGGKRPRVHVDASNRVHLLINAERSPFGEVDMVEYRWSDDGGETWEVAPWLRRTPSEAADWAFGADGAVHLVVHDYLRGRGYFTYAIWSEGAWVFDEFLDIESADQPLLRLGFADRPYVLYGGSTVRVSFFDGGSWRHEIVDEGLTYGELRGSYRDHGLHLFGDGSLRVQYERRGLNGESVENVIAERSVDGTWTEEQGPSGTLGALQLLDTPLGWVGVSDGMTLHTHDGAGWLSQAIDGAAGRNGEALYTTGGLYMVYTTDAGRLTFARRSLH